jgi:hypothetical protein
VQFDLFLEALRHRSRLYRTFHTRPTSYNITVSAVSVASEDILFDSSFWWPEFMEPVIKANWTWREGRALMDGVIREMWLLRPFIETEHSPSAVYPVIGVLVPLFGSTFILLCSKCDVLRLKRHSNGVRCARLPVELGSHFAVHVCYWAENSVWGHRNNIQLFSVC